MVRAQGLRDVLTGWSASTVMPCRDSTLSCRLGIEAMLCVIGAGSAACGCKNDFGTTGSEPNAWRRNDRPSRAKQERLGASSRCPVDARCCGRRKWTSVAIDAVSRLPWADGAESRLSMRSLAGAVLVSSHYAGERSAWYGHGKGRTRRKRPHGEVLAWRTCWRISWCEHVVLAL